MNDIPEMALRNIEDTFGTRFMRLRIQRLGGSRDD